MGTASMLDIPWVLRVRSKQTAGGSTNESCAKCVYEAYNQAILQTRGII